MRYQYGKSYLHTFYRHFTENNQVSDDLRIECTWDMYENNVNMFVGV